ncbi:MAG: DUF4270 domain-containing protein [Chryseobacterium sp.]|uniref:DUF4270 family protein n=1 Tax=Chryseobacterium sp. TaxID=1871047 RepID=UPI000DB83230|nr:DUF4270 family protein [Chryseobacterium sp.]MPS64944.1 DUF4270 family protein [Chryseobacterium sp.]PZU26594.1 MAG: DUF4270 domain-containing protein [Chryseobacterium sp.]
MTYTIKRTFAILFMAIFGSVLLYNCEPETDALGEQLFLNDAAQGEEISRDVIAYNIDNNDSIRSDASAMYEVYNSTRKAVLGAFTESQFGMQRASYFTQVRLPSYSPDFGANPVVDSVVLVVKPTYATDSLTTTTNEDYIYPDGNVAAKKVVNTYPVYKYGKAKINGAVPQFTIKVNEVGDFLNGQNDIAYSNTIYDAPLELGSKLFNGNVNSVTITKDSDASSLYTSSAVGVRIPLSASFFQTKIVDKASSSDLKDASNFIRYFKGIKLSVVESDGYLFQFNPDDIEMIMYYKNDKTENGTTTRPQTTYKFTMGSANAHIGHYEYNRSTQFDNSVIGDKINGDARLFTQGMGGPSIGIKIPAATINELKQFYQNNKKAIIGARIRIYTDPSWNINYANYNNKYTKPIDFTIVQKDVDSNGKETTAFTTDLLNLSGSINFSPYKIYDIDKNPAYYDFTITKSLKDIVETGVDNTNKYFKIDLASFINTTSGTYAGYKYSNRAFSADRAVFIGNDPSNKNKIQLLVVHSKK